MKRQTYSQEKTRGLEVTQVNNKRIILPFKQAIYQEILEDKQDYKVFLENQIAAHPELFPNNIAEGWSFYGFTRTSVKQDIKVRHIQTKADKEVWQIHPSFVMPYMTCDTQTADDILFLAKWAPDMIDRLMRGLDKYLFAKQYFHGTLVSAEYGVRAYCLLSNFRPYNRATVKETEGSHSPFERLNGFIYHGNWLENLLIATSRQEIYRFQLKKL